MHKAPDVLVEAGLAQLAARTGTSERYVREWLEHQDASELLVVDDPRAESLARRYWAGVADRVTFSVAAADLGGAGGYDVLTIFEALHDMSRPVDALSAETAATGAVMRPRCFVSTPSRRASAR